MKRVAVVYTSYDGIINLMCGVGSFTRSFIGGFEEVRKYFREAYDIDLSLHLMSVALTDKADGYSRTIIQESIEVAEKCDGKLHLIPNGTDGDNQFGGPKNWRIASVAAATKALDIAQEYDQTIVFATDTPFMQLGYLIDLQKPAYENKNITTLLVPHSDTLSHESESPNMERLEWEAAAFIQSSLSNDIYIGKISNFLINNLKRFYKIDDAKIINCGTGILPSENRYRQFDQEEIRKKLEQLGIPTDRDLVLSIGRAVYYKGFDILIDAIKEIDRNIRPYLVIIASPFTGGNLVIDKLRAQLAESGIDHTSIFEIDFDSPRYIAEWHKTRIVAQLARKEPFGLVPEETRLWGRNGGPVILGSKTDGFVEQITDGVDGFLVDIDDKRKVSKKILDILNKDEEELRLIRKAGYQRAKKDYDIRNSIACSISKLLKVKFKEREW